MTEEDLSPNSSHLNSRTKGRVWLLSDSFYALAIRFFLIRNAKKSIRIQTFIFGEDDFCFLLLAELAKAAKRGVKVEILVDGWVGVDNPDLVRALKNYSEQIDSRHYNPPTRVVCPSIVRLVRAISVNAKRLNHRMHSKAFIVDEKWAILGGRNYEGRYFGLDPKKFFRDREILIQSKTVKKVSAAFDAFWNHKLSKSTEELRFTYSTRQPGPKFMRKFYKVKIREEIIERRESLLLKNFFKKYNSFKKGSWLLREQFRVSDVSLIHDPPRSGDEHLSHSAQTMLDKISAVERELVLQTPYLVFCDYTLDILCKLLKKDSTPKVTLITNSYATTDNILAHILGLKDRHVFYPFSRLEIYEYLPEVYRKKTHKPRTARMCDHSKTMVLDNTETYIGSSNFDPRSHYFNSEIGILVKDSSFAERVKFDILNDLDKGNVLVDSSTENFPLNTNILGKLRYMYLSLNPQFDLLTIGKMIVYLFKFLIPRSLKRFF